MMNAIHSLSAIRCQTCRLRGMIRIQQLARSRQTSRSFKTTAARALPRRKSNPPARAQAKSTAAGLGDFTQCEQVRLIESLYATGQISREEWRESVWIQAGLRRDRDGRGGDFVPGGVDGGLEKEMGRLREWYAGREVPGELLEGEELVVYERLFGGTRKVEMMEEGDEVGIEGVGAGTGVMREGEGGVLEEVEFEEEKDKEVGKSKRKGESRGDEVLADDIRSAMEDNVMEPVEEEFETRDAVFQRTHPLTLANRFGTFPSTLEMPRQQLTEPIDTMLANISNKHIHEHAHRIFGGPGLPYSTSTSARARAMPQKPIALDAYQGQMAEIEADVYMASLIPAVYASVMSVLVETRKKLGTEWAREVVKKAEKGELKILDAGGGGAGVLAVRELIRAEWESMLEESNDEAESVMAMAELDGKAGGEGARAPMGQATVLTGSDTLRKRAAKLLENTTFVPRLPDYIHTEEAKHKGKFDIVIAPHTLWPLNEDYIRKLHVQNLWSLASADGGVLILLEKGVPRGFEMIAGARDLLLETRIATPNTPPRDQRIDEPAAEKDEREPAMIIAPCTNHASCPMYTQKGHVKGRKDICAFSQRYHRPPFLQRIFSSKGGKNHEDVDFSYLTLRRGRQLPESIQQDVTATEKAFEGYESHAEGDLEVNGLKLPRLILPPLKRKGHVILDLCTPSGTLERWTVPRSFSRTAYRDARKSSWGDLWALGAKTRIPRKALVKKQSGRAQRDKMQERERREMESAARELHSEGLGTDEFGRITLDGVVSGSDADAEFEGGRVRMGPKVKGIRDKRDKKGDGRGRRKNRN